MAGGVLRRPDSMACSARYMMALTVLMISSMRDYVVVSDG